MRKEEKQKLMLGGVYTVLTAGAGTLAYLGMESNSVFVTACGGACLALSGMGFYQSMKTPFLRRGYALIKTLFAPYAVLDSYGTHKPAWTRREAMAWVPYCSPHAAIIHVRRGVIVSRIQSKEE